MQMILPDEQIRQVICLSNDNGHNEQNDVFAEFDKLSEGFRKTAEYEIDLPENPTPLQQRRKMRQERLADLKSGNTFYKILDKIGSTMSRIKKSEKRPRKTKKYRINIKKLILAFIIVCFVLCLLAGAGGAAYVYSIIKDAPEINPNNIYELLSENSVLYDSSGEVIDNIYASDDGKRTNIPFSDMPEDLYNAFIAIEDKTFWEHKGFNVIRMIGAVRDSIFGGGRISGTSTITQQLSRNLYLPDDRTARTLERKIIEAYYAYLIEKHLRKEQIIEAYLNTIQLGFNTSGVQAASQAYFSKDVGELNLTECAALAALPQRPTVFALVKRYNSDEIAEDGGDDIISRGNIYTYVYNGEASSERRNLVLRLMKDQEYIDETRYQTAVNDNLRDYINPHEGSVTEYSSYFADYVIKKVLEDLTKLYGDYDMAQRALYNHGLRIYSTLDKDIQQIIETEFADNDNYPKVANLKKDKSGNILNQNGNILLYDYNNYFDEAGNFTLTPSEYEKLPDGRLKIFSNGRLNFYKTEVQGNIDYSIEFKNMFTIIDNVFYSIGGGFISIPADYKTRDADGNLIISAQFFEKMPGFFKSSGDNLLISSGSYALKQQVIQPQSAMVVIDHSTGYIKAMVGGRNTVGRMLFNRANSPRQPGSSIKPMGVYAPALQSAVDTLNGGSTQDFEGGYELDDIDAGAEAVVPADVDSEGEAEDEQPVGNTYGRFWTAASVIDDSPIILPSGRSWPKNWYPGYSGLYTMRGAIERSVNVCAVKVFQQVGPEYSSQFLKKLGVTTIVDSGPDNPVNDMNAAALSLGGMTNGISPLQMAGGYGTFANQGTYIEPIAYSKITNKYGEVLLENIPLTTEVMDPGVAFIITDMLRSTVTSGIAGQAAIGIQPVAGKTGTTTDNFDAWFVGLTPQYAASLWIGNDVNIELSQGSVSASRLWSKIMKQVCAGLPTGQFKTAPSNVISATIDIKSGLIPSDISALDPRGTIRSEYFIKGTQPTQTDNIHTFVTICGDSGYLATPLCTNRVSAFGVQRPYIPDPSVGDINYEVPHYYCFIHNPNPEVYPVNENALWQYEWEGKEITGELQEEPEDLPNDTNAPDEGFTENDPENQDPGINYDDMPEYLRPI